MEIIWQIYHRALWCFLCYAWNPIDSFVRRSVEKLDYKSRTSWAQNIVSAAEQGKKIIVIDTSNLKIQ